MKKKGNKKSRTGFVASLTPDCGKGSSAIIAYLICKCLVLNLSLGKCCVLHQLRVNVVDSIAHEDMSCTRSLWSKYCVLNFLWVYVVDSVSDE